MINGNNFVLAFAAQLSVSLICMMILIHFGINSFFTTSPTKPDYPSQAKVISSYKATALGPLMLLANVVLTALLLSFLFIYVRGDLIAQTQIYYDMSLLEGCFDSIVNLDIAHISRNITYSTYLESILAAISITEWVLGSINIVSLVLAFYLMCEHKSLTLLRSFKELDKMEPSI